MPYCKPSAELLNQVRDLCTEIGIVGKEIIVEHMGCKYRICCDPDSFSIYRITESAKSKHHIPGWPVCIVNESYVFEEHHCPEMADDHFACGVSLFQWLDIIRSYFHRSS